MSADTKIKAMLTKTVNDVVVVKDTTGAVKSRCHQGTLDYYESESSPVPFMSLDVLYLESSDGEQLPIVQSNEPHKFKRIKQAVKKGDFSGFGFSTEQSKKFLATEPVAETVVKLESDDSGNKVE
jgi:hypothetical protein